MKKVIPLILGLFLFLPVTNAFAISGGYFTIVENRPTATGVSARIENLYDNNTTTTAQIINNGTFTLKEPVNISTVYTGFDAFYHMGTLNFYDSNNVKVGTLQGYNTTVSYEIDFKNVKKIVFNAGGDMLVRELDIIAVKTSEAEIEVLPVTNLIETHNYNSTKLSWENPVTTGFDSVIIKKNGVEVVQLTNSSSSYSINSLDPETTYNFEVIAKYTNGSLSTGKTITVITDAAPPPLEPVGEVIELVVKPTHERVDLSWQLPESEDLKHVNIYRDTIVETSFIDSLLGVQMVYAAETKIFETNGTYFNDLTVEPETTYEYTLTTTSTEAVESEGVTTTVTTLEAPPPEIVGGDYEKDPVTGDYTYSWSDPSTGEVKIMVGGTLYKTVSAADKQIIIPKADMKYTALGDPNVSLIAVAEDGKESVPVSPGADDTIGNVKIPFSAQEALISGTSLLWIIGPFVLLALSFLLVPKLRTLIVNAFNKKNGKEVSSRRSADDIKTERTKELKEQREQREKREREERVRLNERTVDFKNDSKEKAIVKVERTPKERRIREPKPSRTPRERVRRERTPRVGRERS